MSRKQSTSGHQKQDDALDEFDDEDKFLNLDDVLQGQPFFMHLLEAVDVCLTFIRLTAVMPSISMLACDLSGVRWVCDLQRALG